MKIPKWLVTKEKGRWRLVFYLDKLIRTKGKQGIYKLFFLLVTKSVRSMFSGLTHANIYTNIDMGMRLDRQVEMDRIDR